MKFSKNATQIGQIEPAISSPRSQVFARIDQRLGALMLSHFNVLRIRGGIPGHACRDVYRALVKDWHVLEEGKALAITDKIPSRIYECERNGQNRQEIEVMIKDILQVRNRVLLANGA